MLQGREIKGLGGVAYGLRGDNFTFTCLIHVHVFPLLKVSMQQLQLLYNMHHEYTVISDISMHDFFCNGLPMHGLFSDGVWHFGAFERLSTTLSATKTGVILNTHKIQTNST